MDFDINEPIINEDGEYDEEAGIAYRDEIMARFAASPEGQEVASQIGQVGWTDLFIDYGMRYLGRTPPQMNPDNVDEVLFDIFPRKVSTEPGAGPEIILEMRAFWTFLQREYGLPNAPEILNMLRDVSGDEFEEEMQDPNNFDPAKAFFMLGRSSGFDMTTEEGMQSFAGIYNTALTGDLPALPPDGASLFPRLEPRSKRTTTAPRAAKKNAARRKMARDSRRTNRKK